MLGEFMRGHRKLAAKAQGRTISIAALARSIGVTRAAVSNWECGNRLPVAPNLTAWCNALGLSDEQRLAAFDLLAREGAAA